MRGERGRTLLLASCFVLAAITGLSEGGWERVCSLDDTTSNQGVCGKQLAQMLSLVCGLRGYQGVEKRTELLAVKKRDTEGKFFLPKQMAHEFLSKRNKGWQAHGTFFRGITCECCQHRCSLPELTQYCAEPVEKRTINWPSHRKRATGSDVTDPNELIAVEPTRQAGVAEKTYRDIRRLESKSIPRQQLERHVRSS